MNITPRSCFLFWMRILILVSLRFSLLVFSSARADVGVQPVLPGGSNITTEEETPIRMTTEVVVMNVRPATEADNSLVTLAPKTYGLQFSPVWFPAIAEVEADFTMTNPTSDKVSMDVWFPLASALVKADWNINPGEIVPRIESFQASVDGNPVNFAVSELPNPQGADKPLLPWASFPVTFQSQQDTLIHVSYLVPLQPSIKGNEMILYYIFQTGAGWAGSIGQAELIVNLPYPASEGTLASIPNDNLYLPYMSISKEPASLPPGAVLEANQVRWTWKNFEPTPQNDFAIWLLQPRKWQEIENARAIIQANPEDGQAWLELASAYCSLFCDLSFEGFPRYNLLFSSYYRQPGIEAFQKAAEILPDHPVPHAALGLFALEPYLETRNAPPDVIQYVKEQLTMAKELEVKDPSLVEDSILSSGTLESALSEYFFNDATASVEATTQAVYSATEAALATISYTTATAQELERQRGSILKATYAACLATAGLTSEECSLTASPTFAPTSSATITPKPAYTAIPQRPATALSTSITVSLSRWQNLIIIIVIGLIVLIIVGYIWLKRTKQSARKRNGNGLRPQK